MPDRPRHRRRLLGGIQLGVGQRVSKRVVGGIVGIHSGIVGRVVSGVCKFGSVCELGCIDLIRKLSCVRQLGRVICFCIISFGFGIIGLSSTG